ncbi:hypothetical protein GOAMR_45_00420 [Gordonia amarae NBRC 15530]|uniref:YbaB/EbfC DNA-binding family protein n=1 Tax=Gordonia amarae NBRC 15530 TaxID=1075090 RepID=G7GQG9_9ACTN|nr:hypothetical protein GOAMR_45_00420 [Gordonia amarae NBRC 15530]
MFETVSPGGHRNDTGVFVVERTTLTDSWWARAQSDLTARTQSDCSTGFAGALTTVRSRSGSITVTATHQGLPVSIKIADREMRRDMAGLAAELTELCQGAAMVSGIRLRTKLLDEGMDADIVGAMGLPTSDDLADFERRTERTDGSTVR